jgi:hypothetical protein
MFQLRVLEGSDLPRLAARGARAVHGPCRHGRITGAAACSRVNLPQWSGWSSATARVVTIRIRGPGAETTDGRRFGPAPSRGQRCSTAA